MIIDSKSIAKISTDLTVCVKILCVFLESIEEFKIAAKQSERSRSDTIYRHCLTQYSCSL